jgi:hypothetical protein
MDFTAKPPMPVWFGSCNAKRITLCLSFVSLNHSGLAATGGYLWVFFFPTAPVCNRASLPCKSCQLRGGHCRAAGFDPARVGDDKVEGVHRVQEKSDVEEWYGCVLRLVELKEAQP